MDAIAVWLCTLDERNPAAIDKPFSIEYGFFRCHRGVTLGERDG
jgi:hypothetical protein